MTLLEGALGLADSGLFALGLRAGLEVDIRDLAGILAQEPDLDSPRPDAGLFFRLILVPHFAPPVLRSET